MLNHLKHSEIALGSMTTTTLVYDEADSQKAADLVKEIWLNILNFEKQFSRFLPNSELSQFNRNAGPKTKISPEFKDLLLASAKMSQKTGGLYNPFILPALQRAGYMHSQVSKYKTAAVDDFSKMTVVQPEKLVIGDDWASIPHGTALDMGGCGKGYLADQLAAIADCRDWLKGYWFSLGGDISGAGIDENGEHWKIYISDDELDDIKNAPYFESNGNRFAVATSGLNFRKGVHNGKKWHHIIDPTTLKPVKTDLARVSLYSKNCLDCDVLASVLLIKGFRRAEEYLKKHGEIEAGVFKLMFRAQANPSLKLYGNNIKHHQTQEEMAHASKINFSGGRNFKSAWANKCSPNAFY